MCVLVSTFTPFERDTDYWQFAIFNARIGVTQVHLLVSDGRISGRLSNNSLWNRSLLLIIRTLACVEVALFHRVISLEMLCSRRVVNSSRFSPLSRLATDLAVSLVMGLFPLVGLCKFEICTLRSFGLTECRHCRSSEIDPVVCDAYALLEMQYIGGISCSAYLFPVFGSLKTYHSSKYVCIAVFAIQSFIHLLLRCSLYFGTQSLHILRLVILDSATVCMLLLASSHYVCHGCPILLQVSINASCACTDNAPLDVLVH